MIMNTTKFKVGDKVVRFQDKDASTWVDFMSSQGLRADDVLTVTAVQGVHGWISVNNYIDTYGDTFPFGSENFKHLEPVKELSNKIAVVKFEMLLLEEKLKLLSEEFKQESDKSDLIEVAYGQSYEVIIDDQKLMLKLYTGYAIEKLERTMTCTNKKVTFKKIIDLIKN
jgi:hypothetical protein